MRRALRRVDPVPAPVAASGSSGRRRIDAFSNSAKPPPQEPSTSRSPRRQPGLVPSSGAGKPLVEAARAANPRGDPARRGRAPRSAAARHPGDDLPEPARCVVERPAVEPGDGTGTKPRRRLRRASVDLLAACRGPGRRAARPGASGPSPDANRQSREPLSPPALPSGSEASTASRPPGIASTRRPGRLARHGGPDPRRARPVAERARSPP